MLVVLGENSRCHDRAIWYLGVLSKVCGDGGEDSSGADLVQDRCILAEVEGEDVLIVADRDNCLQDKDSRSCYHCVSSAEVGVLPEDSIVLFVAADNIRQLHWLTGTCVVPCVKVFDSTCPYSSISMVLSVQ